MPLVGHQMLISSKGVYAYVRQELLYRVRQASFLNTSDRSVQKRKLACRTFYFTIIY
jgi:hypothetical protein